MANEQAKPGQVDKTADAASGMAAQAERDETARSAPPRPMPSVPDHAADEKKN